ncbi:MAG: hypothetical protein EAX96_16515 [Candidatus Lokiarchaeota archaeon]|nr:hypothetical protein [Candidatus Lokiarchaeota archaeon]
MPLGIILLKWDNEIGTSLIEKFPDRYKVTERLLMSIYSTHRLSTNDPSFATTTQPNMKVLSFFSGLEENFVGIPNHIVALLLRKDENPTTFREILKEASSDLLSDVKSKDLKKNLAKIFEKMRVVGKTK